MGFGAEAVGHGFNFLRSFENDRRFDQFVNEQVNPLNDDIRASVGRVDDAVDSSTRFGNNFFSFDSSNARYNTAFGDLSRQFGNVAFQANQNRAGERAQFDNVGNRFSQGAGGLQGRFDSQLNRARGLVNQFGAQESRDINQRFDAERGRARADLTARGIGGSTVRQSQDQMNQRGRSDALGRLQDRLTTQRLGVEQGFGGAALGFGERSLGNQAQLGLAGAQAFQQGNQFGIGARFQGLGAQTSLAQGRLAHMDGSAQNLLDNRLAFEQLGADANNRAFGQINLVSPTSGSNVRVQPYGG